MGKPEGAEAVPGGVWTLSYNKKKELWKVFKAGYNIIGSET